MSYASSRRNLNLNFALLSSCSCHSLFAVTLGFVLRRSQWEDEFNVGNLLKFMVLLIKNSAIKIVLSSNEHFHRSCPVVIGAHLALRA
jgi:hypothetical protein